MASPISKRLAITSTFLLVGGLVYLSCLGPVAEAPAQPIVPTQKPKDTEPRDNVPITYHLVTEPISSAKERITLKPFALHVTPGASPIIDERFEGYHTGVDFEATAAEKGIAVPIYAICSGEILVRKFVNGYGGVLIQGCSIDKSTVTVLYGHIDLNSAFVPKLGQSPKAGDQIAILGEIGSSTDGERKHLHLGIHRGSEIEYRGYVQEKSELSKWQDISRYFVR